MHTFDSLVHIIDELRSEHGCSWDEEQTHKSSKVCLANESQEVYDAVSDQNMENLCEEPGDILLQAMLHSQIVKEEEVFTVDDAVDGAYREMVCRHPRVSGDAKVSSVKEGLALWNTIEKQEKAEKS